MTKLRSLKHFYQDARLAEIEFPAGKEMRLRFDLDIVTSENPQLSGTLHFQSIQNYDEVMAFFKKLPPRAQVSCLTQQAQHPHWVDIDIWNVSNINIRCGDVIEI